MKAQLTTVALLMAVGICHADEPRSFRVEPSDVASAKIAFTRSYPPLVEIHLRRAKAKELTDVTTSNQFKTVTILIQTEKVAEPRVMEPVTNGVLEFYVDDAEKAVRLVGQLMKKEEKTPNEASQAIGASAPQSER